MRSPIRAQCEIRIVMHVFAVCKTIHNGMKIHSVERSSWRIFKSRAAAVNDTTLRMQSNSKTNKSPCLDSFSFYHNNWSPPPPRPCFFLFFFLSVVYNARDNYISHNTTVRFDRNTRQWGGVFTDGRVIVVDTSPLFFFFCRNTESVICNQYVLNEW